MMIAMKKVIMIMMMMILIIRAPSLCLVTCPQVAAFLSQVIAVDDHDDHDDYDDHDDHDDHDVDIDCDGDVGDGDHDQINISKVMVIIGGSNTFETPQSKFHTINRINHEIPFHFMKKVQAMFSVKHLFSTSLDFCLCRNKTSHFHKFHILI